MRNSTRFYSLEIIIYSSDVQSVINCLLDYSNLSHYCCILHDSDVDINGELKKPHIHFIATFSYPVSFSLVSKMFSFYLSSLSIVVLPENCCKIKTTLKSAYDYLIHKFEPDKFQYSSDLIFSDMPRRFSNDYSSSSSDVSFLIVNDILEGRSLRSMAMAYGRDFVLNYARYKEFALDMSFDEKNRLKEISPVVSDPFSQVSLDV